MVHRQERARAKALIEKFVAGEITNDDLTNDYPREREDRAIPAIYERLWGYWDDRHSHKLSGKHQLTPEASELFRRCVAFLDSDLEYEWPPLKWFSLSRGVLKMLRLSKLADKRDRDSLEEFKSAGRADIWPFMRDNDYRPFRPK